jgi:hypothetical protein
VRPENKNLRFLFYVLLCLGQCFAAKAVWADEPRNAQHDFDFQLGTWRTHISRLLHPLSGSKTWVEMTGTKVVRKVWNGRAFLEEVEAGGPKSHFEGLTFFLYNPESHQWSLNFANSSAGTFSQPAIGEFKNGRGEFFDQETFNGRTILVRIVWSDITANSHRFEQSFSDDGGKTWEPNFVARLTRDNQIPNTPPASMGTGEANDPQHAFDWEQGDWKLHVKRLQHPLTGSHTWSDLDGTVTVRPIWGGKANLAEIEATGPTGHLEFLSLRLYNPQSHQWNMNFASSNAGTLSVPMFGEFKNGHGEFYDQEPINGRAILVRFVFEGISPDSGHSEQAFSDDGGKTWEVNWINTYTRVKDGASTAQ